MKIKTLLQPADNRRLFLKRFFTVGKWKFVRLTGGPLLILTGILLFHIRAWGKGLIPENVVIYFCSFCVGFGIYYGIRPFLMLLNRKFFSEISSELETLDDGLRLADAGGVETVVPYANVTSAATDGKYLQISIFTSRESRIILPLDRILEGDAEKFAGELAARITGPSKAGL